MTLTWTMPICSFDDKSDFPVSRDLEEKTFSTRKDLFSYGMTVDLQRPNLLCREACCLDYGLNGNVLL